MVIFQAITRIAPTPDLKKSTSMRGVLMSNDFSPKILGFLCNRCCYAAADAAGVSRFQYPPNLRTIRVMCTGRVDPAFILRGFIEGADGIFTGG